VNGNPEAPAVEGRISLFPENELAESRKRWQDVQSGFVDDPRSAVRKADELVATVMSRLAQIFADERAKLEHEWDKGDSAAAQSPATASRPVGETEDLRLAFQRYRSFFDRLLSV
jgi:hypothetical protein